MFAHSPRSVSAFLQLKMRVVNFECSIGQNEKCSKILRDLIVTMEEPIASDSENIKNDNDNDNEEDNDEDCKTVILNLVLPYSGTIKFNQKIDEGDSISRGDTIYVFNIFHINPKNQLTFI